MVYRTITTDIDIDVADILGELTDDDLIEEMESRGLDLNTEFVSGDTTRELLTQIWLNKRLGKDYQQLLDQLIYYGLGKVL
jgi:hypothetical protein